VKRTVDVCKHEGGRAGPQTPNTCSSPPFTICGTAPSTRGTPVPSDSLDSLRALPLSCGHGAALSCIRAAAFAAGLASERRLPLRVPHGLRETTSLATAVVRPIPLAEARKVAEQYEPFCCTVGAVAYGLFLGPALASVVVFGPPAGKNLLSTRRRTPDDTLREHSARGEAVSALRPSSAPSSII
jgi:hypothetical protein